MLGTLLAAIAGGSLVWLAALAVGYVRSSRAIRQLELALLERDRHDTADPGQGQRRIE